MSPEDEARARLLAHYDRIREDAVRRLARLQEHLAGSADADVALELRTRIEGLRSVIADMEQRAGRVRDVLHRAGCSSDPR
jgi:hypothetical protein